MKLGAAAQAERHEWVTSGARLQPAAMLKHLGGQWLSVP